MEEKNQKLQDNVIADLQNKLNSTLIMLDLSGTNEAMTKVLTIVNQAFIAVKNSEDINPEKIYLRAMQIYERQKEES